MYVCLPVLKWALPLALAMLESSCSTYTGSTSSGNASHHDSRARYQQKQCFFWPYSAELCCFFKICVFCRKFCRHYPPDPRPDCLPRPYQKPSTLDLLSLTFTYFLPLTKIRVRFHDHFRHSSWGRAHFSLTDFYSIIIWKALIVKLRLIYRQ